MNQYINAEKLKLVIKAQINERKNWMKDVDKSDRQDQLWSDLNGEDMSIIQIINSLQQEQPKLLTAKDVWRNMRLDVYAQASGANYFDEYAKMFSLCDIDEIFEGIGDAEQEQQEQSEMDLEKEIDNFLNETGAPYVWCNDDEQKEWCNTIARHFYELGRLNARKEE